MGGLGRLTYKDTLPLASLEDHTWGEGQLPRSPGHLHSTQEAQKETQPSPDPGLRSSQPASFGYSVSSVTSGLPLSLSILTLPGFPHSPSLLWY